MLDTAYNVRVIPATKTVMQPKNQYQQLRVAAYCRVSTEKEEQQNSYQTQISYYTDKINSNKEWGFAGIFAEIIVPYMIRLRFRDFVKECKNLLIYRLSHTEGVQRAYFFACCFRQTILNVCKWVFTLVILHTLITMELPITIYRTVRYEGVHIVLYRIELFCYSQRE